MKQTIPIILILSLTVFIAPASAMPQGVSTTSVLELRTKEQPVQLADFKKEKKRKKTAARKKANRDKDKRSSGDGFLNDDARKSRERDGFHQKPLKDYGAVGPEIRYYHRKKRSGDEYKENASYNKD